MEKVSFLFVFTLALIALAQSSAPPLFSFFDVDNNGISKSKYANLRHTRIDHSSEYRLDRTVIPEHYDLEIQPILSEDSSVGQRFTAPGKVRIRVVAQNEAKHITLHSATINITESTIRVVDVEEDVEVEIISSGPEEEIKQQYTIYLQNQLRKGKKYDLYMEFVAPIPHWTDRQNGLYLSSYIADSGERRYMAVTDFESSDNRRMTPSFDEPDLKATWKVSIIRQREYHSLANMDLERIESVSENWVKDIYSTTTFKIPTYLVAIAVTDYLSETADPLIFDGKPVKVWGPPPLMKRGAGAYTATLSAKAIEFFQTYLDVPYTFPKMDSIAIPDFAAGAMENIGLNTYKIVRLMYLEGVNTIQEKVSMSSTIAHELAHQWFGDLVTMKWWDDIWLNEGFATYFATLAYRPSSSVGFDEYDLDDFIVVDSIQAAFKADVANTSHPLHAPNVDTREDISVLFDILTYDKGASLIRMMNNFLGESNFKAGLKEYLNTHQHANANQDELFFALQKHIGTTVLPATMAEVMESWTKKTSYPLIRVEKITSGTDKRLKLIQERMLADSRDQPSNPEDVTWMVPITYARPGDALGPILWLTTKELPAGDLIALADDDDYFIFNVEQTGYYRVKYDASSLDHIISQLNLDHEKFDTKTRSAFVDDGLTLALAGYSTIQEGLDVTKYLKNETTLMPWFSFVNNMATPYRLLARTSGFTSFRNYVRSLVVPPLQTIGFNQNENEHVSDRTLLRNKLYEWACNLGDAGCIQHARKAVDDWMNAPGLQIPAAADIRPYVYCTAVANHPEKSKVFNFIYEKYQNATHDTDQVNLLKALACSKDNSRLQSLLQLALDTESKILSGHRISALQYVASSSVGADVAFYFIYDNLDTIISRLGVNAIGSVVSTLSTVYSQEYERDDLIRLANNEKLSSIKTSLETYIANVERNMVWMNRNYSPLVEYFKANV